MRSRGRTLVLGLQVAILAACPSGAATQIMERDGLRAPPPGPPRLDLAFGVGGSLSTDWSEQVVLETQDASGARTVRLLLPEVTMAPGWTAAAGVTYWRGPLGVRANAAFTRACLTAGESRCDASPEPESPVRFVTEVDVWSYGIQGLIGLMDGALARAVRPYLLLGAAGVTYDPEEAVPAPGIPTGETTPPTVDGDIIVVDGTTNLVITVDRLGFETRFAVDLGTGLDLRLPLGAHGIGLRMELVDQLTSSPLGVRITRLGGGPGGESEVASRRALVHTLRATIGLLIDFGLPEPVARDPTTTDP